MRARIRETEWHPVLYFDTKHNDDDTAASYGLVSIPTPPVLDIPDDLAHRYKKARRNFQKVLAELEAWRDSQLKRNENVDD